MAETFDEYRRKQGKSTSGMISDWAKRHEPEPEEDRTGVWDEQAQAIARQTQYEELQRQRGNVPHAVEGYPVVYAPPNTPKRELERIAYLREMDSWEGSGLQEPEIDPVSMVAGAPLIVKDISTGLLTQGIRSLPRIAAKEVVNEAASHTPYYFEQMTKPSIQPVSYPPPRRIPTEPQARRVGQFTYGQDRI